TVRGERDSPHVPPLAYSQRAPPLVTAPPKKAVLPLPLMGGGAGRLCAAPPAVPAERIAALRQAFEATLVDPEFRADAEKAQLEIEPLTASEIEQFLARAYGAPPAIVRKAAALVEPGHAQ